MDEWEENQRRNRREKGKKHDARRNGNRNGNHYDDADWEPNEGDQEATESEAEEIPPEEGGIIETTGHVVSEIVSDAREHAHELLNALGEHIHLPQGDDTPPEAEAEQEQETPPALPEPAVQPPTPPPPPNGGDQPNGNGTPNNGGKRETELDRCRRQVNDLTQQLRRAHAHAVELEHENVNLHLQLGEPVASPSDKLSGEASVPQSTPATTSRKKEQKKVMATPPSAEKKRLVKALKPLTGWSESALMRHSETDLQELFDKLSGSPSSPTLSPSSGGSTTASLGSNSTPSGMKPCPYCVGHPLVTDDQYLPHMAAMHPQELAKMLGISAPTPTPTSASPAPSSGSSAPPSGSAPPTLGIQVLTPRIVGVAYEQAQKECEAKGLTLEVTDSQPHKDIAAGSFISQEPQPYSPAKSGDTVKGVVSSGKPTTPEEAKEAEKPPKQPAKVQMPDWLKKVIGTPDDFFKNIGS